MKRDIKRILVFSLFAILIVNFLIGVVSMVSAADTPASSRIFGSNTVNIPTWIKSGIDSWGSGSIGPLGMKILFLILLSILVYSAMTSIGLSNSEFVNWGMGIIISIIATGWMTPEQFFALGAEYGTMGMSISALLPFVILSFFSFSVAKKMNIQGIFIQKMMWLLFAVFLTIRLIGGLGFMFGENTGAVITDGIFSSGYLGVITILAWITYFFNRSLINMVIRLYEDALKDADAGKMQKATDAVKMWSKTMDEMGRP